MNDGEFQAIRQLKPKMNVMNSEECAKFANERFVCSIATVDDDQPHVRRARKNGG